MKQQFFVGDKVYLADKIDKHSHVFWIDAIEESRGIVGVVQGIVTYESGDTGYSVKFDNRYYNCDAKWLTIVERAWQKNTGVQPVDDDVVVQVKQQRDNIPLLYTGRAKGFIWIRGPVISVDEWRIADSGSSDEEQPEAIPPSHVALVDELAAVDATSTDVPTKQEWTDKHYDNNYTLTQKDIERGFVKIDPYFVSKMWKIGSKDDSGALWHCKNKYSREVKPNIFIDVYDVLRAFEVTDPCLSHLAKKALCAGLRGHKDRLEDLNDIKASIERAIEMHLEWSENGRV